MTRMLASVTGPTEAAVAVAHGADIIDLSNPARGALAAVETEIIRATVDMIGRRRAVSAAAGDLPMDPAIVIAKVREIAGTGVDYVRVGIVPGGDPLGCLRGLAGAAAKVKLIAVFFADFDPELTLLPIIAQTGFAGAMIDTHARPGRGLLDCFDLPRLYGFVQACHAAKLISALAGSLETPDIPRMLLLAPDLLGFRRALCATGEPTDALDTACLDAVRGLIPQQNVEHDSGDVDYRLLSARGHAQAAATEHVAVDRVIVEQYVLPVSIGAYARERQATQRVRFSVDAAIIRGLRPAEDMRDVFSYDLITDGIRLLVETGHFALVETLAERIADMVLSHRRVIKVVVRVEKLDTGPALVGVQIERTRNPSRAMPMPLLAEASRLS